MNDNPNQAPPLKVRKIQPTDNSPDYVFFCPACKCAHGFYSEKRGPGGHIWAFNGNPFKPTLRPSLLIVTEDGKKVCHSVVTDGRIEYCKDSTHELAGHTVDLQDF